MTASRVPRYVTAYRAYHRALGQAEDRRAVFLLELERERERGSTLQQIGDALDLNKQRVAQLIDRGRPIVADRKPKGR